MILVLADDITGAAEIAGVCLHFGLSVEMSVNDIPKSDKSVGIIITDTRSLSENQAYKIHLDLIQKIKKNFKDELPLLFKKCDSVLRGYVLTEILPFKQILQFEKFILQPANPEGGRTIQDGKYWIADKKIAFTAFSKDPDFPAFNSSVKRLLVKRNSIAAKVLRVRLNPTLPFNDGVMVYDCENTLQMTNLLREESFDMAVGSSAFFEQWLLHQRPELTKKSSPKNQPSDTSKLFIAGSIHQEVQHLEEIIRRNGYPILHFPDRFLTKEIHENAFHSWIKESSAEFPDTKVRWIGLGNKQISFAGSSEILKTRLTLLAENIILKNDIREIIVIGGASAYHLINHLKWTDLEAIESLGPGIIRLKINGTPIRHLTIKPGSYPWPEIEKMIY